MICFEDDFFALIQNPIKRSVYDPQPWWTTVYRKSHSDERFIVIPTKDESKILRSALNDNSALPYAPDN
ncbi:MAG: hypothetical protein WCY25_04760 [Moheibacter sp.]